MYININNVFFYNIEPIVLKLRIYVLYLIENRLVYYNNNNVVIQP